MILLNPVVLSVIVMTVLCLLKLNVLLALIVSALVAGFSANMPVGDIMGNLINGMGGNAETALSYVLLGTLAVAINSTGVASILSKKIASLVDGKKKILLIVIAVFSCFSQNLIPVHIAFIPILIPPLLKLMNELKLDRRAMACSLTFSFVSPCHGECGLQRQACRPVAESGSLNQAFTNQFISPLKKSSGKA